MENPEQNNKGIKGTNTWLAALRVTAPVVPIIAALGTALIYFALTENFGRIEAFTYYTFGNGGFAVTVGILAAIFTWIVVAFCYRRYTAADSASRRNYNLLREKLDRLRNRIEHASPDGYELQEGSESGIDRAIRDKVHKQALMECEEIEKKLKSKGMPWVTGIGYIELWHRVHRAEEALIKVEPCTEAIAGAMRDESRLKDSTMTNKELLLKRLRCAVAILDDSETGKDLNYLEEPAKCSLPKDKRAMPKNRAKAITVLSEVRYEINYFRDNVWEGIVHARNRLADTSVLLGLVAYVLLGLAVFANASHTTILWVAAYFLVGAIAGLFARAQAEWSANTAVDDFGLSTARLIHIPWLSGLAAVGGVLVTSVLDSQFMTNSVSVHTVTEIFSSRPALLIVAAIFGLTPDLLIRRLAQQTDRYKEDLQSTQTSKSSTETSKKST